MTDTAFESVAGYQDDPLALPVSDLDAASKWYCNHFAMDEVERGEHPVPHVVLERDGVRIGFAINGGDASQDGAAIKVNNIDQMKADLESRGCQSPIRELTSAMVRVSRCFLLPRRTVYVSTSMNGSVKRYPDPSFVRLVLGVEPTAVTVSNAGYWNKGWSLTEHGTTCLRQGLLLHTPQQSQTSASTPSQASLPLSFRRSVAAIQRHLAQSRNAAMVARAGRSS